MFVFEVTSHKLVSDCNSTMRYYLIKYTYFVVPKNCAKGPPCRRAGAHFSIGNTISCHVLSCNFHSSIVREIR